jgi:hypothetical protein
MAPRGHADAVEEPWWACLAWVLDAFDFTILTFLLVDIQRSFTVDKALAGALGTVTLICNISAVLGSGCWRSGFSFSTLLKP